MQQSSLTVKDGSGWRAVTTHWVLLAPLCLRGSALHVAHSTRLAQQIA